MQMTNMNDNQQAKTKLTSEEKKMMIFTLFCMQ